MPYCLEASKHSKHYIQHNPNQKRYDDKSTDDNDSSAGNCPKEIVISTVAIIIAVIIMMSTQNKPARKIFLLAVAICWLTVLSTVSAAVVHS